MIIYKVTNLINGKIYIGQTKHSLEYRKQRHLQCARNGANNHLYQAIRKYGESNFKWEVIHTTDDKDELNFLETYYIGMYDSIKHGYNMVDGGDNNIMNVEQVRLKHCSKMRTPETRNKISKSMKEYRKLHPFTKEHRKRLSEKAMGNHNFGSGDTRSIGCYCIDVDGIEHHFHSYRDAWKWWKDIFNPFNTSSECVFQRKIKQSINNGYYTYGHSDKKYEYPKWYREDGDKDEKVAD